MTRPAPPPWVARTAALLLGGYAVALVVALASPSSDPQRGMANGFLTMVLLLLAGLGALLRFGAVTRRRWLVWAVFLLSAYPAVMLVAQGVYLLATRRR
jgi:hypothetical protein